MNPLERPIATIFLGSIEHVLTTESQTFEDLHSKS
jgi:hypothetical protein